MRPREAFITELRASAEAVERVAWWLTRDRRISVVLHPTFEAPSFAERAAYADEGDLHVMLGVEVKRRALSFTGRADYPFPDAIVDDCACFDGKRPRPFGYVLLNRDMTAGLYVDVWHTQRHWTRRELFDGRTTKPFYLCSTEHLGEVTF